MFLIIQNIRNFYGRFERPISSLSLVFGFVFDAVTLKRVDTLWENIWIFGHLVIIGIFMALIHVRERGEEDEKNPSKAHFWYVNILQFFFGGILSTYLVFYFRSADIFVTWPFIALLALTFFANESLKRHYVRLSFQISLFFLSVYSFMIFLVPVTIHKIGDGVFLFSGLLSLVLIALFLKILFHFTKNKFAGKRNESGKMIVFPILGIFILINFLYFTNLIPPIPLSLKDAGVYHSIRKNEKGNYEVTYEDHDWRDYFNLYPDFKQISGKPVYPVREYPVACHGVAPYFTNTGSNIPCEFSNGIYAFSAIFSPKNLNLTILHEWQHYDEIQKKWITASIVNLPVIGGRDGGFRTYSMRSNLAQGRWRVNVKTQFGQIIGRLRFKIIPSDTKPLLTTAVK